ncbi:hypothetical protein RRG08_015234 [Elysia crispata]|uniref:Uncharacterized protein n=1 Tax=Elysia crispata TaxID=231223 RepID=A0AAE1A7A7_9GAST|nr:hypothetical protein RRG08_015234 [Elysia crispata]
MSRMPTAPGRNDSPIYPGQDLGSGLERKGRGASLVYPWMMISQQRLPERSDIPGLSDLPLRRVSDPQHCLRESPRVSESLRDSPTVSGVCDTSRASLSGTLDVC